MLPNSINPDVYKALMKELAQTLETQFSGNAESRAAGMVINTMGWVEGLGYEVIVLFQNVISYLDKRLMVNIIFLHKSPFVLCSYFSMQLKPSRLM